MIASLQWRFSPHTTPLRVYQQAPVSLRCCSCRQAPARCSATLHAEDVGWRGADGLAVFGAGVARDPRPVCGLHHQLPVVTGRLNFYGGLEDVPIAGVRPGVGNAFLGKRLGDVARAAGHADLESRVALRKPPRLDRSTSPIAVGPPMCCCPLLTTSAWQQTSQASSSYSQNRQVLRTSTSKPRPLESQLRLHALNNVHPRHQRRFGASQSQSGQGQPRRHRLGQRRPRGTHVHVGDLSSRTRTWRTPRRASRPGPGRRFAPMARHQRCRRVRRSLPPRRRTRRTTSRRAARPRPRPLQRRPHRSNSPSARNERRHPECQGLRTLRRARSHQPLDVTAALRHFRHRETEGGG